MTRIAILSDVHGNARAFKAALNAADERGYDRLVLLGDLLTYGPDYDEVLDIAAVRCSGGSATLIEGNHDRLYADLARGVTAYYDALPAWLRECADLVMRTADISRLTALPFAAEYVDDRILFAHANPYGVPDWTYLNGPASHEEAATVLAERKFRLGVFGHTHRVAFSTHAGVAMNFQSPELPEFVVDRRSTTAVLNSGSVGQPRDGSTAATFALMTTDSESISASILRVPYDVDSVRREIGALSLSAPTLERLLAVWNASA